MNTCYDCGCELSDNEVRWGYDTAYCESCFDERFNYCSRCDVLIGREETLWSGDEAYCNECYQEEYDEDCPDNPAVYDSDRKLILQLSRNWLSGKHNHKTLIKINSKDYLLTKLKDMVGLVDSSIYVFGLLDRDEYQISASPDIIEDVREYLMLKGYSYKVIEGIGCRRLGISHSIRKQNLQMVANLIKRLTKTKELINA